MWQPAHHVPDWTIPKPHDARIANALPAHGEETQAALEAVERIIELYLAERTHQESRPLKADDRAHLDMVAEAATALADALADLPSSASDRINLHEHEVRTRRHEALQLARRARAWDARGRPRDGATRRFLVRLAELWERLDGCWPGGSSGGPFWRLVHACHVAADLPTDELPNGLIRTVADLQKTRPNL